MRAGGPVKLPKGDLDERQTAQLIKTLVKSERDAWRKRDHAVRYADCTRKRAGAAVSACIRKGK